MSTRNSVREKNWQMMYERLIKFKTCNNHCNVPSRYVEDPKLGNWVSTQRKCYKNVMMEKQPSISQSHVNLLNIIGFVWVAPPCSGRKYDDEKWLQNFEQLKKFKNKYGHCSVPQRFP